MSLVLLAAVVVGAVLALAGLAGVLRDPRRIGATVLLLVGGGTALLAILLAAPGGPVGFLALLVVTSAAALITLGYPLLTVFLLANGVVMLHREARALANLLSGLAGLALLAWPFLMVRLIGGLDRADGAARLLVLGLVVLVLGTALYVGFAFLCFLTAAFAYRVARGPLEARYVIVLGSGLDGDRVPPLLAARLERARELADAQDPPATIIASGGRGPDELVAEGTAMADWLRARGVADDRLVVEDRSTTTRENLRFSRELLPARGERVLVVTNGYHVFRAALLTRNLGLRARVAGARTAPYYVPSAFLREFVAVMNEHRRLNAALYVAWLVLLGAAATVVLP